MVLQVVAALGAVVKVNYSRTLVDSITAQLHYKWTATYCLVFSALLMASNFIGDSISCINKGKDAPKYMNTYCWIKSTFTINSTGPLPGLGLYDDEIHDKTVHSYYQWVPIVLAIQAALFYLPHYLWKTMEGKQVDHLLQDVNKSLFDNDADKKIQNMIRYLRESWGLNIRYFTGHFACECLYLLNVVLQMFLIDKFFDGAFLDYGTKVFSVLRSDDEKKNSVFLEVFPRQTKCTFYTYGDTGDIVKDDTFCILPQNILNEKIFLAMWLWFIILTIITCLQLIWHLMVYSSESVRKKIMTYRIRGPLPAGMEQALRVMHIGDFCLLNSIGMNLDVVNFKKVMEGVTRAAEEVYNPSAPVYGTYKPFSNDETMPRRRVLYPTLS